MNQIMDGKSVASIVRAKIKNEITEIETTGQRPKLSVIIVGENPASLYYVRSKQKFATEVGIESNTISLPIDVSERVLLDTIEELNDDTSVHGILVQLPLPEHIDEQAVIAAIDINKDVDGFHPAQVGRLSLGLKCLQPCTPAGIMELLKFYDVEIAGKNVVIVGRSNIVGKPIAQMLVASDATVTITHSKTSNLADFTRNADILVVAIGRPGFISAEMVKDGAVVIDVGINRVNGKIVGDVDFDEVSKKSSFITPVPGGVGPMTIAMLLFNTLSAFKNMSS